MNNCGNCQHYGQSPMKGPICTKTGKEVSFLSSMPCYTDRTAGPEIQTKRCNRCHRELPVTDFCRKSTERDGYQRQCKECQKELAHKYYENMKAKRKEEPTTGLKPLTKRCAKCGQILPVSEFGHNDRMKDGLKSYCKECERENNRIWKEKKKAGRIMSLHTVSLDDILAELRLRGYTGYITKNQITL